MNQERDEAIADRAAEARAENEGMPEHPAQGRDPGRLTEDRRKTAGRSMSRRAPVPTVVFGLALMSCAMLAALTSARGAIRWMRHKGGIATHPR
jgi:hypothetical protein